MNPINTVGKKKGRYDINKNIKEWRKRLAMLPEEVVKKALENNTNLYFNIEAENQKDPRRHFKYSPLSAPPICPHKQY